jgi:hypothetical protein
MESVCEFTRGIGEAELAADEAADAECDADTADFDADAISSVGDGWGWGDVDAEEVERAAAEVALNQGRDARVLTPVKTLTHGSSKALGRDGSPFAPGIAMNSGYIDVEDVFASKGPFRRFYF